MASKREYDLIIFGATGFTGYYMIRELLLTIDLHPEQYSKLKWAVAGRNETKLTEKLNEISKELNHDLSSIEKIIADISDPNSLLEMARRTQLVINAVGPYYFYGRPVVTACVEAGTHHIDISGEPNYIESMVLEYHKQALEKNLLIISTCGWDSIPCDIGVDVAKRNFKGRLHSVETFVQTIPGALGYRINFGTFQSAINGYRNMNELKSIRRRMYTEIFNKKLPKSQIVLKRKTIPFTRPDVKGWQVEFPGSDRSVVQRTQYYFYEHFNEPPIQIQTYFTVDSFSRLILLIIFGVIFASFTATSFGTRLLEAYPEFFSGGMFSKKGPSREQIESTRFRTVILGKGWSEKIVENLEPDQEPEAELDETIKVVVSGPDPGYVATSTCIVQAGLTILFDLDQMPRGGVLTPAAAFRNTKLLERLNERNVKFEVFN